MIEIWDTIPGTKGVKGEGYGASPPSCDYVVWVWGLGSVVSSLSGIWGRAPAENRYGAF